MKCEVIRDLIPLFDEKLCSPESADLVAEHIKTCADCKALLEKLPKTELPKAAPGEIKPFVKVKRKLRQRVIGLISLGVVLLAVLIPVGYLTVNQIFHINGGTDFETLIYKHKITQFAEMIVEGRMEEYTERLSNVYFAEAPDGTDISERSFYLEKLNAAYEKVKKYDPRVYKVYSNYHRHPGSDGFHRQLYFTLLFTRADGSPFTIIIANTSDDGKEHFITEWHDPRNYPPLFSYDPEKTSYEQLSVITESDIPDDVRDIYAFVNTLYLADGGDFDITFIDRALNIEPTPEEFLENHISMVGDLVARRFAVSDYKKVYDGYEDFIRSGYSAESMIGSKRLDAERNMYYYPVMMIGSDGEHETAVSIKLYIDEFGFHSPRPEDIKGADGGSDLEKKLAGIFG